MSLPEMQALFRSAGLDPAPEDWAFFERLRLTVIAANEAMNLTRLTGEEDFYRKHVLDSALPFHVAPALKALGDGILLADVGSGGGFPGLVLARLRPTWDVALIERTQKKAAFLEETAEALGLDNVFVVPLDARETALQVPILDHKADVAVARAVGRIGPVTRDGAALLRRGGIFVHYKGGTPDPEEMAQGKAEAEKLGFRWSDPLVYDLPPDAKRSVVLLVSRSSGRTRGGRSGPRRARRGSRGGRGR